MPWERIWSLQYIYFGSHNVVPRFEAIELSYECLILSHSVVDPKT